MFRRALWSACTLILAAPAAARAAEEAAPAGGAAIGEVIIASVIGGVSTLFVLGPVLAYRRGKFPQLGRFADSIGRIVGLPGWAAMPLAVLGGSLIVAVFGMYWDIS